MDRSGLPSCTRCKQNYHISDANGSKIPMLLICGHDMCKSCIKFLYKKRRSIICEVCQTDCKIETEDEINNLPLHYYLLGKVWYLSYNKQRQLYRNISNLQLRNLTNTFVQKSNICDSCYKCSEYFCHQCNEMYCHSCFKQHHTENQNFNLHDIQILNNSNNTFVEDKICDQHSRPIDIICVTCQLDLCSICAIDDHRLHDIQPLEKYNLKSVELLDEYSKKGDNLLKKLKFHRDELKSNTLKHGDLGRLSKKKELEAEKHSVTMFVCNAIGSLQCLEQNVLNLLNKSEMSGFSSLNRVTDRLSASIDDLQNKLNMVEEMSRNRHNSSALLSEFLTKIELLVNTTFYIAKKDETTQSRITFNYDILSESIKQCIVPQIEISDTYLLELSPEFPPNYTLYLKIDNSDLALTSSSMATEIRPYSSLSSKSSYRSSEPTEFFPPADEPVEFSPPPDEPVDSSPSDHYVSYVKEITKNEVESVIITHINSPSDFYLQLQANVSIMKLIENKLNKFVLNTLSAVDHIEMNNVMYAVLISSDKWYRGNIVHINKVDNENVYTVLCIDYGFTKTITANSIRNVPADISIIPPLAYNCALYDLKPSSITGWSNDTYSLFSELILEKTGSFYMYPINLNTERIEVDIVWKKYLYPLSIRDALFFLKHGGNSDKYVNSALHKQLVNTLTLPKAVELKTKESYFVVLSHLVSPSEFYLRIDNEENSNLLREAMELLDSKYKPTEIDTHKSYLLYTPQIGMAVAARYTIDSNWYRAKIISLPEPRMVTVFYIDYGNSETLPWDQLRVLDHILIKTPPLAVRASLADVSPATDGVECANWNDKACALFIELTTNRHNIDEHLTTFVHSVDNDTYSVILYSHTSRGEICINQKLLSQGYAANSDPMSSVFLKPNFRKPLKNKKPLQLNRRMNQITFSNNDDTLAFLMQRPDTDVQDNTFQKINNENAPGLEMLVFQVVSPDEIILKYVDYNLTKLTERMNKVYTEHKIKKIPKVELKENNLCAVFTQKYGNWYRGQIVNVDKNKKTTSIYLYDLAETLEQVPTNSLYVLENRFVVAKSGLVRCCMDNLIPLGTSDGKWPKFSCDRLIEKLNKYRTVYFTKTGKKDMNIVLGEIWVKDIEKKPNALEPICNQWINLNKFMIDQGFALTNKQNAKDNTNSSSELDLSVESIDTNSFKSIECWLPPTPITKSPFDAFVMYIDMECNLYLQIANSEVSQLLSNIEQELNEIFANSEPEPQNYQWTEGQMVIANYFLNKKWYRGTIVKKIDNNQYTVQFIDYGNIETCSHENLRSTVYMTDIPQLCVKGYFSNIISRSENGAWSIKDLDYIHGLLVEHLCTVTVDLMQSSNINYAITYIKTEELPNVCQYLVTNSIASFAFVKNLGDDDPLESIENPAVKINVKNDNAILDIIDMGSEANYTDNDEINITIIHTAKDKQNVPSFTKFCLKSINKVIEGTVCAIAGPTQMRLLIHKVNGADITIIRDQMHIDMFEQCADLPVLENFDPGTAVVVLHNIFWRRGIISNNKDSVILVDMGVSIRLVKKNLRACPPKYFKLPMFSVECHLANVTLSKHADERTVAKELSKSLRSKILKIIAVDQQLDTNVIGVELFDNNNRIAYQSLIDSGLLIPK